MRASLLSMWEPAESNRKTGFALMESTNNHSLDHVVLQDLTPAMTPATLCALLYARLALVCVNRRKSAVNISFPNLAPFAPLREDLFFQIARSISF